MFWWFKIENKTWNVSSWKQLIVAWCVLFVLNEWTSTCISGFSPNNTEYNGFFVFSLMLSYLCLFQEAIQLDGEILFALLRRVSPLAFRHLEKHKIDPILYMTEWFMCAFSRTLPWASVLRVWDMFLCDGNNGLSHSCWSCARVTYSEMLSHLTLLPLPGVKIIFRVGLVLLKCMLGTREKLKACQGQYETMELLRAIEPRYMQEGFLVREVTAEEQRHGVVMWEIILSLEWVPPYIVT